MIRTMALAALAALICGAASGEPLTGAKTYDMLFRNGTLDDIDRHAALIYGRDVTNKLRPEAAERDSGQIALSFREGEVPIAMLELRQGEQHRKLGSFPASVGNPMIMYFYESVIRDMAEAAGGSPFYIRNRVKEALVRPTEIETGAAMLDGKSIDTRTIRMRPFADDPNAERMMGFGDLEMRVTMSDAVPGWYLSFVAEASGGDVYRSELRFRTLAAEE